MEAVFNIDWQSMFVPQTSLLEVVIRGSIMWFGIFALMRLFRRQAGAISMADLLVIVIIADAAQNGMAGDAKSVTEAVLLIGVIIFWDYLFDWLGFKSKFMSRIVEPEKLLLIENGEIIRKNLASEILTEEELLSQLRLQGVESVSEVKTCYLESNGRFSVITNEAEAGKQTSNENGQTPVN